MPSKTQPERKHGTTSVGLSGVHNMLHCCQWEDISASGFQGNVDWTGSTWNLDTIMSLS